MVSFIDSLGSVMQRNSSHRGATMCFIQVSCCSHIPLEWNIKVSVSPLKSKWNWLKKISWLNLRCLNILYSVMRIISALMNRNTTVGVVIIELICLFCLISAVYFCPGCSATGNHSSKSFCINNANMHTVAVTSSFMFCAAQNDVL